jgi:hypothetical protein
MNWLNNLNNDLHKKYDLMNEPVRFLLLFAVVTIILIIGRYYTGPVFCIFVCICGIISRLCYFSGGE